MTGGARRAREAHSVGLTSEGPRRLLARLLDFLFVWRGLLLHGLGSNVLALNQEIQRRPTSRCT
jgi:hypothetical protein